jgi:hypothetical protein
MTAVRFDRRDILYAVTITYDPIVVDVLKLTVPSYARSWRKPRREWLIEVQYAKALADALRRLGAVVIGLEPEPSSSIHDHWARAVFQRVGPTRAAAAYKLLSRVCHPDHGGDHQLQIELNQAYAAIERRTA